MENIVKRQTSELTSVEYKQNLENTFREIEQYRDMFDLWGHGEPTVEKCQRILNEGIITHQRNLGSISYDLSEIKSVFVSQINDWGYHAYDFVVIIAASKNIDNTTNEFDPQSDQNDQLRYYFGKIPPAPDLYPLGDFDKRVSRDKIIGYIDNFGHLIRNGDFDPDKLNKQYEEIKSTKLVE